VAKVGSGFTTKQLSRTGAAALLVAGWVSAGFCFAAYNDLSVTYRPDGMILCNGDAYFPLGVYFEPVPNVRTKDDFLAKIAAEGRGFCYQEFAANGGNMVMIPTFHFNPTYPPPPAYHLYDSVMPSDITDYHEQPPNDCTADLTAANQYGVKLFTDPNLAYSWGAADPYLKMFDVVNGGSTTERTDGSREAYFNTVKGMVEASGAGAGAFFGWTNCWEAAGSAPGSPPMFQPTGAYVAHVWDHIRTLESNAGATHPVYSEENTRAIVADTLPAYNAGCDILAYNVRICPAPYLRESWDAATQYKFDADFWASDTGNTADVQHWSVEAVKPLLCCVDAVWSPLQGNYYFPPLHQMRFMSYDAVIHRCNGLLWGMWSFVFPDTSQGYVPDPIYDTNVKPVVAEMGLGEMYGVLRAPYDETVVSAVARKDGTVVERTALVGGDLAPKNHLLSGNYLIEGCVKYYDDHVYLIAACREGRDSITGEPVNNYAVTFRPFFSGDWADMYVTVINEDVGPGIPRTRPVGDGTFTDNFQGEDVHIYKFTKPPRFGETP